MKPRRILVPVDFSSGSDAALEMATSLARDGGGSLILMHVEIIPLSAAGGEYLYAVAEPPTDELRNPAPNCARTGLHATLIAATARAMAIRRRLLVERTQVMRYRLRRSAGAK